MNKKVKVYCPICNKRILDIEWDGLTIINIKCMHCRKEVVIKKE